MARQAAGKLFPKPIPVKVAQVLSQRQAPEPGAVRPQELRAALELFPQVAPEQARLGPPAVQAQSVRAPELGLARVHRVPCATTRAT